MDELEAPPPLPAPRPPSRWERWLLALTALGTAGTLICAAVEVARLLGS